MYTNYQGIQASLRRKNFPVYLIIGQDPYLQNDISHQIKSFWKNSQDSDEQVIDINDNWRYAFEQANSYSLFSEKTFLELRFNKKSFDKKFKPELTKYLTNFNSKSLIVIKAPLITNTQIKSLSSIDNLEIISANPLKSAELERWIRLELQRLNIKTEQSVASLIHQHSHNNMLAAQQTIAKLNLINEEQKTFTTSDIIQFINDQSEYPIYELTDACLQANSLKVTNILRKFSQNNQNTSVYILWLLSHEIRQLLQLKQLINNSISMQAACKQLKIWPQKIRSYEVALHRFTILQLETLLNHCAQIDTHIKSQTSPHIWDKIEQLALLICLGWKQK